MPTGTRSSHRVPTGLEWLSPWIQVCEISWTAPQVIAHRTYRMMWGGWPPSARDRREYKRMGQEKTEAFAQAMAAAVMAWPTAGAAVLERTLAPVHRRVLANNRRLSRR